jgi:hypothetical protein
MWRCDRHDKITYCVSHTTRAGGGVITRLSRSKWHVESDDTGEVAECPTLTKAFFWVQHQADMAAAKSD